MVRGRVRLLTVGVIDVRMAGLRLDRVVVRVENARLRPGLIPRLQGGPVTVKATVSQDGVDRWIRSSGLPLRLELTEDGILSSTGIGALRVGHVLTELEVAGSWLRLRPRKVAARDVPGPLRQVLVGNLPLPALPSGARLVDVSHGPGALFAHVSLEDVDEALTPGLRDRVRSRLIVR
jgi:hypothetical protein